MIHTVTHISICPSLQRSGRFLHIHFDSKSIIFGSLQDMYRSRRQDFWCETWALEMSGLVMPVKYKGNTP